MPRVAALSQRARAVGRERSAEAQVPVGMTKCVVRLPRNGWPVRPGVAKAGEVVEATVEISFDGGQTWPFLRGVGSHGGDYFNRRGDLVVETTLSFDVPEPDNPQRRVRATLETHVPLTTRVDLDFE